MLPAGWRNIANVPIYSIWWARHWVSFRWASELANNMCITSIGEDSPRIIATAWRQVLVIVFLQAPLTATYALQLINSPFSIQDLN